MMEGCAIGGTSDQRQESTNTSAIPEPEKAVCYLRSKSRICNSVELSQSVMLQIVGFFCFACQSRAEAH